MATIEASGSVKPHDVRVVHSLPVLVSLGSPLNDSTILFGFSLGKSEGLIPSLLLSEVESAVINIVVRVVVNILLRPLKGWLHVRSDAVSFGHKVSRSINFLSVSPPNPAIFLPSVGDPLFS